MTEHKNLVLLGSTGSIGKQTLEVVRQYSDRFSVVALACGSNDQLLEEQIRQFRPSYAVMYDEEGAKRLKDRIADLEVTVLSGMEGLCTIAALPEADVVLTAVVGMIGIRPTIAAIQAGKDIALANKETLVTAGHIIMPMIREKGVALLPVDSEHSAIFQSLQGNPKKRMRLIYLTASGGPFRGFTKDRMQHITPADALKHPNWNMGRKITIDSATMVNKGLEVMEAGWLFDASPEQITVVVHPQSIVHSMVEYEDGAVIAQMGVPDMKLPIQYALTYPDRLPMEGNELDLFALGQMTFEKPDPEVFTGLALAFEAFRTGGSMPTVYNAANERAVALFLEEKIGFLQIPELIEKAMRSHTVIANPDVDQILAAEQECYEKIDSWL
ncbi:MAG: 1-deoxy-D-xylulose-5-phosphate reductoisomerase [Lachnospiraceae bacterium]|nr:1-deoxy-D-xylulose-5-phosphate reductoisomerase [Lachnospiraceae bacterium]